MRLSLLAVTVVLSSLLSACGSPMAGGSCNQSGFLCESAASALECRVGAWVSLPCKGPNGCQRSGDTIRCDMSGNAAGDACASSAERKGLCTADGKALLECVDGTLVKTNDCSTCTTTNDVVTCSR